jgi:preprotein translocase subunit SecA
VLAKVYKVEFGTLPPYKPKRMAMEENIVVRDYCWLELVILQIFHTVESERSVLVVCKTIRELEELTKGVEAYTKMTGTQSRKVRIYRDEECSDVVHESVDTREIILATNISGRGTDFHTTEQLERKGGLHVILAFLPANQRVQDQALGRTGRQGNQGSGQLLLK